MLRLFTTEAEAVLAPRERLALTEAAIAASRLLPEHPDRVRAHLRSLSPELVEAFSDLVRRTPRSGYLLVRGVDIGEVPATPVTRDPEDMAQHVTSGVLALVAEALGGLVGFADEKAGALIHDIHPVPGEEERIENSGSVAFGFHTENVHHPLRPDFLGLLCLRRDHESRGATQIASIREAVQYLAPEDVEILRRPAFQSYFPTSFTRTPLQDLAARSSSHRPVRLPTQRPSWLRVQARPRSRTHAVLFGPDDRLCLRYNEHNTQATDPAGTRALRALASALGRARRDVTLAPGDLMIVCNHVAAHGRSAFTPRYDGRDRWLRRFYALRGVPHWAEQMMPSPRVLPSLSRIDGVL